MDAQSKIGIRVILQAKEMTNFYISQNLSALMIKQCSSTVQFTRVLNLGSPASTQVLQQFTSVKFQTNHVPLFSCQCSQDACALQFAPEAGKFPCEICAVF